MIINDTVLDERRYTGATPPPASFEDVSRYKNNGVHTAITWVRLPSGLWVRSFDGATSVVDCGADPSLFNFSVVTVSAWSKAGELTGTDARPIWCFEKDATNRIYLSNPVNAGTNAQILGKVNNVVVSVPMTTTIDLNWHYLVCVLNGTQWSTYYDGNFVSTEPEANLNTFVGQPTFYLGNHLANYYLGQSGLVKVDNYALTADQIYAKYQNERGWFAR